MRGVETPLCSWWRRKKITLARKAKIQKSLKLV